MATLLTNLQGYWKLDESSGDAVDSSGNGNTLTNNGGATYGAAIINNGVILASASSQYLSRLAVSIVGIDCAASDMSAAGWINFTSSLTTMRVGIFGTTGATKAWLFYHDGVNALHYNIQTDATHGGDVSVSWTPSTGTWYHIVATYNKTTGATNFYLNGAQLGTTQTSTTGGPFGAVTSFDMGSSVAGGFFNGKMDEWGVWNRELSSSEASQLYNGGAGFSYPFPVASFPASVLVRQAVKRSNSY